MLNFCQKKIASRKYIFGMEATTHGVTWRYLLLFVAGRYKGAIHINRFRPSIQRTSFSFLQSYHNIYVIIHCISLLIVAMWLFSPISGLNHNGVPFKGKDIIKVLKDLK